MMWKSVGLFVFLLCLKPYLGYPQYDLGQQISHQVRDSLKDLDHLGSDIRHNVHQQLRNAGIHNLGSRISADVQQGLAPLDNLGAEIEEQVHRSLLPVYAMSIRNDMAHGIGGTTIATHRGKKTRTFIIQNGKRYVCKGTITGSQCDGNLEPFQISSREDHCHASSYAVVNNNICLSSGPMNVMVVNNHISCDSGNNSPVLILTRQEFDDLCGDAASRRIVYKYYANSRDPRAIPIPNSNPYVKCQNNEPGVCEFEGDNMTPNSIVSNGSSVVISGGRNTMSSGGNSYTYISN